MSAKTLQILRLTRYPKRGFQDELHFGNGVNLMVGGKDSGKSEWFHLLDFLLGDSGKPSDAFGKGIEENYQSVEAEVAIDRNRHVLSRSWSQDAAKTKMTVDGKTINIGELSGFLLDELGIPKLHFPKGSPYAERAWPAISFRTLFRHIYRQERFWSEIADKQHSSEQHACLALFLGVAEALFPPEFGELVEKQQALAQLEAKREAHRLLLDELSADLLKQKELTISVTDTALDEVENRVRDELKGLRQRRTTLLADLQARVATELNAQARSAKLAIGELQEKRIILDAEQGKTQKRLIELRKYSDVLQLELGRFKRAKATSEVFADLKVTHCPVCDKPVEQEENSKNCFLCHREHVSEDASAANRRVEFEEMQIREELSELQEVMESLAQHSRAIGSEISRNAQLEARLEIDLVSARESALALLPPDLALIDQT